MSRLKCDVVVHYLWPILLPFLVFVLHALLFRSWLIDDAGISFAYARNFIHGHGLVSQPGVQPVEGFSNPLWTLLVSPLFITDPADPTLVVKLLSFGLILGTFTLVAGINQLLFGLSWWSRSTTVAVLLLTSVNTSFVVWTTSGLENPLYAFLFAFYSFLLIMYATDDARRSATLAVYAGLISAGLALTRPDGLIFLAAFPGVIAIRVLNDRSQWKAEGRRLFAFLVAFFLPMLVYVLFRVAYFGDVYPNTYHAKGGPSLRNLLGLFILKKAYIDKTYDLFYGIFSWCTGIFLFLFLSGLAHLVLQHRKRSAVVFLLPLLVCSWIIYCLLPGDWMGEYRFATPFFLALALILFALLSDILVNSSLSSGARKVAFLTVATLFLAHSAMVYVPRSFQFAEKPTVPFDAIARKLGMQFNFYASELGISEASLLAPDLGGTLYFSQHRVYDLAGLCDREIALLIRANNSAKLRDYVFELRPTFIHIHSFWSVRSGFFSDDRFRELYAPIQETSSQWADIYSGDYVLKDAIVFQENLERLRRKLDENTQHEHAPNEKKIRPFPRG